MAKEGKLRSYHFSLGDSTRGPVGYCARMFARSKPEAAELLLRAMEARSGEVEVIRPFDDVIGVEYVSVYFGPAVGPLGVSWEEARAVALAMLIAGIDVDDESSHLFPDDESAELARIVAELDDEAAESKVEGS